MDSFFKRISALDAPPVTYFGVDIAELVKREETDVPLLLSQSLHYLYTHVGKSFLFNFFQRSFNSDIYGPILSTPCLFLELDQSSDYSYIFSTLLQRISVKVFSESREGRSKWTNSAHG